MTEWREVRGADGAVLGWMAAPDPAEDTVAVMLETRDGDPVAMTHLAVDYFGGIDDDLVPQELIDAELVAKWADRP